MKTASSQYQTGFTLLESLVAIVVMSLGLLGLAGLQAVSMRDNQTAYLRSIATQQAYDMADRIRANRVGEVAGNYDSLTATIPSNPNCITTTPGCTTAANVAITDHFQWNTRNAAMLPNGVGTVDRDGTTGAFDITVSWTERVDNGNQTSQFVMRFWP
jgi:type IV pilus assembly protein PilV